jgi:L-asparagine transporter-like permease
MTFYWKFFDTLVYNVATICAFIVAVSQFLIRSFNENDGGNKVRKFINQSLFFVNRSTSAVYNFVNKDTLPEVKKPKRRAA